MTFVMSLGLLSDYRHVNELHFEWLRHGMLHRLHQSEPEESNPEG